MARKNTAEIIIKARDLASAKLKNIGMSMEKMGGQAKAAGKSMLIGGAAITAGMTLLSKHALTVTNDLWNLMNQTDLTAQELQELDFALEQDNVSSGTLAKAISALLLKMNMASQGMATYTRLFDALDVAFEDGNKQIRKSRDVLLDLADAMKNTSNETKTIATLTELLGGRVARELIPPFRKGSAAIIEMGKVKRKLGLLTKDEIELGKRVGGVILDMTTAYDFMAVKIGIDVLPLMEKLSKVALKQGQRFRDLDPAIRSAAVKLGAFTGIALTGVGGIALLTGHVIQLAAAMTIAKLSFIGTAFTVSKVLFVITAIALVVNAGIIAIFRFISTFGAFVEVVGGSIAPLISWMRHVQDAGSAISKWAEKIEQALPLLDRWAAGQKKAFVDDAPTRAMLDRISAMEKLRKMVDGVAGSFDDVANSVKSAASAMIGTDKLITPLLALGTGVRGVGVIAPVPGADKPGILQVVIQLNSTDEIGPAVDEIRNERG